MSNETILLVEDNPDDIDLTLRAFSKNNIINPIKVARDGEEALDYMFCRGKFSDRNIKDLPSLILLDINLPKINGIEVLKEIRSNPYTKLQPIVVLTTSREEKDIVSSYKLGVNSYVRKPVDFEQFIDAVKQLGLYWLVLNTPPGITSDD